MYRRTLLAGAATSLACPALAYRRCEPTPMGRVCEVGIPIDRLSEIEAEQEESQWCWAAAISMIFSYYDHPVEQERIVEAVYGRVVNLPAMSGAQISSQLAGAWRDDDGRPFRSRLRGLYDVRAGIVGLDNQRIITALREERPLLFCNLSHAMVLTAIAYGECPTGPVILNAGFADPWPGIGLRGPRGPGELLAAHQGGELTYLALPEIVSL